MPAQRITTRNARFQQWQALLGNRTKRQRSGEFLVQGVRPITLAAQQGWPLRAVLFDDSRRLSGWAVDLLESAAADTERVAMAPDLLAELGEKDHDAPELVAVVAMPPDDLARIPVPPDFLGVLFDRPTSPGNIGTLLRSSDAFGAHGLIVTGHGADVYDPRAVRASTGSLFAVPAVRTPSHREVGEWLARHAAAGRPALVVGTDEDGDADVSEFDFTGPVLLVVGNETAGMSSAWRDMCDRLVRIPMVGTA